MATQNPTKTATWNKVPFCLPMLFMLLICSQFAQAENTHKHIEPYLSKHCYECHDDDLSEGGLNLYDLEFNLNNQENFYTWQLIFDRVKEHEMPPKKKKQPIELETSIFLEAIEQPLYNTSKNSIASEGRTKSRRLTNREYEYTLYDLLGIDIPIKEHFPEDTELHGFETVAAAQQLSYVNLQHYLDVANLSLRHAFDRSFGKTPTFSKYYTAKDLTRFITARRNYRGPEKINNESFFWPINLQFYGRMRAIRVPRSGWYEITIKNCRAINPINKVIWGSLKSGICASSAPLLKQVGYLEATSKKKDFVFRAWMNENDSLELSLKDRSYPNAKRVRTANLGHVSYKNANYTQKGLPGIAVSGIHLKQIHPHASHQEIRQKLLGPISYDKLKNSKSSVMTKKLLKESLITFASKAFRKPVSENELKDYIELMNQSMQNKGEEPWYPLFIAYQAILCSPRFLNLVEEPGVLDAYSIASRLSYMLWNSMPDEDLFVAAKQNFSKDPKALLQQVDRMLADKKSERFIISFTDQWLELKNIDETVPKSQIFKTYDESIQDFLLEETRTFFREMLMRDLSITNLIQSNFNIRNEKLSRFYEDPKNNIQPGDGFKKVSAAQHSRNGLVSQSSILKVTTDGTHTSPVTRGVWIGERILGLEIPPPPSDVPAIEPDIRGAISIREKLKKHRDSVSCASCHQKIDSTGFAFENFNPVGLWRTKYGPQPNALKVDASGMTLSGTSFKGLNGWKAYYANQPELLTKAFSKNLLTYATGAKPTFSDRNEINAIVEQAKKNNYGMQSILKASILSSVFKTK